MSAELDYLQQLDHEQLDQFLRELQPREWEPGEQERIEAKLADHDPDSPVVVLPPLKRAA